ncbi:MAG: valine--tRNA ligase [Verrucomicrobia bacterium]|nr:valine--tRNA ligase [Verrucomicrobiota bacterium]
MIEIPKAYEPQSVEDKWYDFWVKQNCFTADPARVSEKRPAYSIVIPPPNVTGVLHMGHVLNNTIQDILARKARMDGKEVLWLPGTDHAGIATEGMVAKQIRKEEKKSKQDIGREEFLKRVWTWKEKHGGIIIAQLKKLGCSCDWTRERFTMEPDYVRNVQRVFVDLYKKGLIYRGKRMVNWCPATLTALSDEEVEMKPQKGFMYHFKVEVAKSAALGSATVPVADSGISPISSSRTAIPVGETSTGAGETPALPGPDGKIWLTIATTRPETIPGDTAVAVNPKDARYAHLIGKHIVRPLPAELPREQKLIPIIGDEHVDFEFGTGVLKVTPAHDKADFDIGTRHKLPLIEVINADGSMNDLAGADLKGLDRFKARKVAVEKLTELGALVEEKPYENNVGFSQRADVPIEPRLSEQWFLKYPAVEKSKACVEQEDRTGLGGTGYQPVTVGNLPTVSEASGRLPGATGQWPVPPGQKMRFHPQRWAKVYDHWLTNIQDWCISRQLWWGHQVPVWSCSCNSSEEFTKAKIAYDYLLVEQLERADLVVRPKGALEFTGESVSVSIRKIKEELGFSSFEEAIKEHFRRQTEGYGSGSLQVCIGPDSLEVAEKLEKEFGFTQDPDVLDTWFSSWLWPFATMGWPEQTETLKAFYPTTDLVTAPEIIFFWVARMIMAGYEYMGELPFRDVYFTGIVRDKQGRKMSKSLGNSPDPLELIAKYGADAIRFGTMRSAPLGQDVMFDEKDVELGRNFCNKLWNACRFRQMVGSDGSQTEGEINPTLLTSDDKWILLRLDQAIREVSDALAGYNFSSAVQTLYRFFWSEYCDWYVEASKAAMGNTEGGTRNAEQEKLKANKLAVMDFVLGHTLRLFHPFLPFITEELWHGMGFNRELPEDRGGKTIVFATWPKPFSEEERTYFGLDDAADKIASAKYELVSLGRSLRRELKLDPAKKLKFTLKPAGELPANEVEVLKLLLNAEAVEIVAQTWTPAKGTPSASNSLGELFLPTTGLIDFTAERERRAKEAEKIRAEVEKVRQKLTNPSFAQKVPAAVLAEHQQRLAGWETKLRQVELSLENLPEA